LIDEFDGASVDFLFSPKVNLGPGTELVVAETPTDAVGIIEILWLSKHI
jgi:hypothetical protein